MKRLQTLGALALSAVFASSMVAAEAPFGSKKDVKYAASLWALMEKHGLAGENAVITRPYTGMAPHGTILELLEMPATLKGHTGPLVVKRNYGGDGLSIDDVINEPDRYLKSVTVMYQRENGYDAENGNWFYVKYDPQGNVMKNPKDMALAGRVAKGMDTGCIACHATADGGDFIFNHNRYK